MTGSQHVSAARREVADVLPTVVHDLSRLDSISQAITTTVTTAPPLGSPAEVEHGDEFAAFAYDLAATFISASVDHLTAWRALVVKAGTLPSFAHISLCRVAHESAYVALWLMEPGLPVSDRAARGVAAQLDDYDERRKVEDALGVTDLGGRARSAGERYDTLLLTAERRGMTKPNKQGKQVLCVPMPSHVELFDAFEPAQPGTKGSFLYRIYSGYTHGKQWAAVQGGEQVAPFDGTGRALTLVRSNPTAMVAATQRAVNALERAVSAFVQLHRV